jgi:hypothetical protein
MRETAGQISRYSVQVTSGYGLVVDRLQTLPASARAVPPPFSDSCNCTRNAQVDEEHCGRTPVGVGGCVLDEEGAER